MATIKQRTRLSVQSAIVGSGLRILFSSNRAPVWAGQFSAAINSGSSQLANTGATDPESQAITYSGRALPSGMTHNGTSLVANGAETGPRLSLLAASDGQDVGEVVGLDVGDDLAGVALLSFGHVFLDGAIPSGQHGVLYTDGQVMVQQSRVGLRAYPSGAARHLAYHALVSMQPGITRHVVVRSVGSPYVGTNKTLANIVSAAELVTVRVEFRDLVSGAITSTVNETLAQALTDTVAQPSNLERFVFEGAACCEVITVSRQLSGSTRIQWHVWWVSSGVYAYRFALTTGDTSELTPASKSSPRMNIRLWAGVPTTSPVTQEWLDYRLWCDSPGFVYSGVDGRPQTMGGLRLARWKHDLDYLAAYDPFAHSDYRDYTAEERDSFYVAAGSGIGPAYTLNHDPLGTYLTDYVNNGTRLLGDFGHQDDIGIYPRWHRVYLAMGNWNSVRAGYVRALNHGYQAVMRAAGSTLPLVPAAGNDNLSAATDTLMSGWASSGLYPRDTRVTVSASGYKPPTHYGDSWGLYLLTGDPWIARGQDHDAAWNHFTRSPPARGVFPGSVANTGRGVGWAIRSQARAYLSHIEDDAYGLWLAAALANNASFFAALTGNERNFGLPPGSVEGGSVTTTIGSNVAVLYNVVNSSYFTIGWAWVTAARLPVPTAVQTNLTTVSHAYARWVVELFEDGRYQDVARGSTYPVRTTQPAGQAPADANLTGTWADAWSTYRDQYGVTTNPPDTNYRAAANFRHHDLWCSLMAISTTGAPGAIAAINRAHAAANMLLWVSSTRQQNTFSHCLARVTHGS